MFGLMNTLKVNKLSVIKMDKLDKKLNQKESKQISKYKIINKQKQIKFIIIQNKMNRENQLKNMQLNLLKINN